MSAPPANMPPTSAPPTSPVTAAAASAPAPSPQTLVQAAKLAMQQDKAIMMDYFLDTESGRAFLGEDTDNNEKMLIKGNDEFTSLIQKIYKVQTDFIILTENSIYIVSGKIQKRRIKAAALRSAAGEF